MADEPCGATRNGLVCERERDHPGVHRGYDAAIDEPLFWPADPLPRAIRESTFTLYGVRVRCYVLDDGQRIVDASDFEQVIIAISAGVPHPSGDVVAFALWRHGQDIER